MIKDLEIINFRVVAQAQVEFDQGVTAFLGTNGAGKTSVLEALYLLGHGRSHRSADRRPLIRRDEECLRIISNVMEERGLVGVRLGLELNRSGELLASVDRERVRRLSQVLHWAPVLMIDSDVQGLFSLGSTFRRKLLDWGMFHVEHSFAIVWGEYQRALRQRNAALKNGSAAQARVWNVPLSELGSRLQSLRSEYVGRLEVEYRRQMAGLLDGVATLQYRAGWTGDLGEALEGTLDRDLHRGFTSVGPHRADVLPLVSLGGTNHLSRGQQKLVAIGLLLAQVHVHATLQTVPSATVLLDDAGADLDVDNLGKLYDALRSLPAQLVVTAIDERALQRLHIGRMFHVEHGMIRLIP